VCKLLNHFSAENLTLRGEAPAVVEMYEIFDFLSSSTMLFHLDVWLCALCGNCSVNVVNHHYKRMVKVHKFYSSHNILAFRWVLSFKCDAESRKGSFDGMVKATSGKLIFMNFYSTRSKQFLTLGIQLYGKSVYSLLRLWNFPSNKVLLLDSQLAG
jgi:hypothetical protein